MKNNIIKKIRIIILVVGLIFLFLFWGYNERIFQGTSPARLTDLYSSESAAGETDSPTTAHAKIETYVSSCDTDKDGIDDQTDILQSAIDYINTKPKYKSKYYETGYPDDQFGVCTDVVAFALQGAGFDLMTMVQSDIAAHSEDYDISEADPNIDFRRVKNLKVFFKNTAIPLTTDIYDIEKWQGGDIVIFKNHIGIVSDRRNTHGVTYVIHHNDPGQKSYEEDILESRGDIVGHYRISE